MHDSIVRRPCLGQAARRSQHVVEAIAVNGASQGDDVVGARGGPAHAAVLQTVSDDWLAASSQRSACFCSATMTRSRRPWSSASRRCLPHWQCHSLLSPALCCRSTRSGIVGDVVPPLRIELRTSPLPRVRSTTELRRRRAYLPQRPGGNKIGRHSLGQDLRTLRHEGKAPRRNPARQPETAQGTVPGAFPAEHRRGEHPGRQRAARP